MNSRNSERFNKIRNTMLDLNITASCLLDVAVEKDDDDMLLDIDNAMERLYDAMDAVSRAMVAFDEMDDKYEQFYD